MSPGQWLFLYGAKDVLFDVLAHLETALTLIQRITRIRLLYIELAFLQFKLFSSLIFPLSDPLRQRIESLCVDTKRRGTVAFTARSSAGFDANGRRADEADARCQTHES